MASLDVCAFRLLLLSVHTLLGATLFSLFVLYVSIILFLIALFMDPEINQVPIM